MISRDQRSNTNRKYPHSRLVAILRECSWKNCRIWIPGKLCFWMEIFAILRDNLSCCCLFLTNIYINVWKIHDFDENCDHIPKKFCSFCPALPITYRWLNHNKVNHLHSHQDISCICRHTVCYSAHIGITFTHWW